VAPTALEQDDTTTGTPAATTSPEAAHAPVEALLEQDLLVEDVSIDGMCGVY
jgi:mycofactocin precursor